MKGSFLGNADLLPLAEAKESPPLERSCEKLRAAL